MAECDAGIAAEEFWRGRLRSSCRFFDEALVYAEKTMLRTDHIEAQARVFFRYMQRISATLYSDVLDEEKPVELALVSDFAAYTEALEAMDEGNASLAARYLERFDDTTFFARHLQARLHMEDGEYQAAKLLLQEMLKGDAPLNEIGLYSVICELEICCRETEDYKGAYTYASERVQLLEQLLKE